MNRIVRLVALLISLMASNVLAADAKPLRLLFLGDNGHHRPADRAAQLVPVMAERGIEIKYTDRVGDLNAETLKQFDGLIVFANIDRIEPDQARALLDYVAGGKGFIPLHCASFCFRNNDDVVALIGAQFQKHGTGVFRTTVVTPEHPIMKGYRGFESWDETYVHTKHNTKDRTVLEVRAEGDAKEPWTWVRTHGKGRVFYTAWGHDERTWGHAGFQNLVERGIRWACGGDPAAVPAFADKPEMTPLRKDVKPFAYAEANVPFYPPSRQSGTRDAGKRKMQLPVEPTESMKHLVTPVGFEAKLFASEPQLAGKPIAMNWDERGRLWICESYDYPNELQPQGEGRDRIRICEDTDGDGRADKFTVFAEKLSIPSAIAFYRGGAIVQDGRETVYLKDTNGDDVSDLRKVLITGWGLGDTHGGVSNFQFGPDNWFYGMQGYNNSEPTYDDGRKTAQSFRQGFFRFKMGLVRDNDVVVSDVEFLRSTNNNTWGLGISEEGLIFGSTANGNPSEFLPIPNRYYESVRGWSSSVLNGIADSNKFEPITENVRQVDHHGGFTAAAGHALYTARNYPKEYWNRAAFVTEPTGHLVATFILRADGAGFRSKNSWNLLASNDEWTAPIMAEVGPDGNVWVIDWYNYIVQHNPTPAGFKTGKGNAYESELRDKKHGRIYRVVNVAGSLRDPASGHGVTGLHNASPAQLVAALQSDNLFWRRHAQRLLIERGSKDIVPALTKLVADQSVDEIGLNPGAIHALWTLQGLGALTAAQTDWPSVSVAIGALKHRSAGVRRAAVMVLPRNIQTHNAMLSAGVLTDRDNQVRLASFLALAEMPSAREPASTVVAMLTHDENLGDRWLTDALTSAAARQERLFLTEMLTNSPNATTSRVPFNGPARNIIAIAAEHHARGVPADSISELIRKLPDALPQVSEAIITGWAKGWPKNKPLTLDDATETALFSLLKKLPPAAQAPLVTLASRWGSKKLGQHVAEIAAALLATVQNDKVAEPDRVAAASQLVEFRRLDAEAPADLLKLISPRTSPELAKGLLEAVAKSESREAGATIVASLGSLTPASRPVAIRVLLSRADGTKSLLDAVESGTLRLAELSLDQKQALAAHPDRAVSGRAKKLLALGGGLPNPDRQKVLDELLPLTKRSGDAVAGKEVFKKQCAKCHTHSGEGSKVGPDLTGMAVHPKLELLTNVIDPSRSVEGNFRVYTVAMTDGRVLTGLLASETKTTIEIFDAEGKKHAIQRDDIEELVASTKSLMPEGFEKQVSPDEIANLLEFLTQRGKFLPLPLAKAATIVSTKGMFNSEDAGVERLIFADWSPKTFAGVPFLLVDPQGDRVPNVIMLHGTAGSIPPKMPKSVTLPCNSPAKAIHFLGGISGWGFPASVEGTPTLTVRLNYADGKTEDHVLKNGEHFADYIRRVDVPGSKFAFSLRGQQVRYLAVLPKRPDPIATIELMKGNDITSPVVMAVTVESP
ncbi:MAG: ThuA domain-containing protein [Planctomycetales bacterium]|nr:ThuA domain-containing protein [Planctomycetales bacterium]